MWWALVITVVLAVLRLMGELNRAVWTFQLAVLGVLIAGTVIEERWRAKRRQSKGGDKV